MFRTQRYLKQLMWLTALAAAPALAQDAHQSSEPAGTHDAATHAADSHGEHDDHAKLDPIKSGTLANAIATLVTFAVLLFILGKFVWPVVLKALNDRESFIRESLMSAKQDREEAAGLMADYKAQLEQARRDATALVDEGRRDAEVVRRQMMDDARNEADATLKRAKREIEIARDTAVKDIYTLAGGLATDLAGKILQKELDPAAHDRLIQESLEHLSSRGNGKGK